MMKVAAATPKVSDIGGKAETRDRAGEGGGEEREEIGVGEGGGREEI